MKVKPQYTSRAGFTLIELMVIVGIGTLMVAALSLLIGRAFSIDRFQQEQFKIVEDTRIEMERISDVIRNARNIDCNDDGVIGGSNERWLQTADANNLIFYGNADADAAIELVRFYVDASDPTLLRRVITKSAPGAPCTFSGAASDVILLRSLRNHVQSPSLPLFEYYKSAYLNVAPEATPLGDTAGVIRVRQQYRIDANLDQPPPAVDLLTEVSLRFTDCSEGNCLGDADPNNPPEAALFCPQPIRSVAPRQWNFGTVANWGLWTLDDECKQGCFTNFNLPPGQACSGILNYTANFQDETIVGTCACAGATNVGNPGGANPQSLEQSELDGYVAQCLGGAFCPSRGNGRVTCSTNDILPLQCSCSCTG